MRTETITTHDIRLGDRIACNGMVLLVDQEPHQTNHPVKNDAGITLATRAVVENWDELVEDAKTDTYIAGFIVSMVRDDMSPYGLRVRNALQPDTEPRWTIQGNGWAHWSRIVSE